MPLAKVTVGVPSPVVRVPLPRVTLLPPTPDSEPMVWLTPLRSRVAPLLVRETAVHEFTAGRGADVQRLAGFHEQRRARVADRLLQIAVDVEAELLVRVVDHVGEQVPGAGAQAPALAVAAGVPGVDVHTGVDPVG